MEPRINIEVEFSITKVVESLVNELSHNELLDFVEELNEQVCDEDFTNNLYDLFKRKYEEWIDEMGMGEEGQEQDDSEIYPTSTSTHEAEEEDDNWTTVEIEEEDEENVMDVFNTN